MSNFEPSGALGTDWSSSNQSGSISNKISQIKSQIQELKQQRNKENADKEKLKGKSKEIQKNIVKLIEGEIQTSMAGSINKLKRFVRDRVNDDN